MPENRTVPGSSWPAPAEVSNLGAQWEPSRHPHVFLSLRYDDSGSGGQIQGCNRSLGDHWAVQCQGEQMFGVG